MDTQPPPTETVTTTMGAFYHWVDTPTTVALVFALAGAVFVGIYAIRRLRGKGTDKKV
jgi:flagellar biogenesis protein FliO